MLIAIKYHVASRGLRKGNTWRIYRNIDDGYGDAIYVEHININVESWTGEDEFGIGFSMICDGELELEGNLGHPDPANPANDPKSSATINPL